MIFFFCYQYVFLPFKIIFLLTCSLMVNMRLLLTIIHHIQVMILDIVHSFELYREVGINRLSFSIRVYINEFFIAYF